MTRLSIRHETIYSYGQAISFGLQRLLLRPRDSHADRVVEASLELSPPGETRWAYDAMDNCLCWYQPNGMANALSIVSSLVIDRFPAPLVPLQVEDPHTALPIVYSLADRMVLNPFILPATEADPEVMQWLRSHTGQPNEPALDFLTRLARGIQGEFAYAARDAMGVQTPSQTIAARSGACRDFAWLMIEALRHLGYAARFVTGYLYSPATDQPGAAEALGAGATHAWCDVFLPGLGWMEFDPTNGLAESPHLIRVGATRTPEEAAPISGSIIGDPRGCEMSVKVVVRMLDGPAQWVAA